MPPKKQFFAKPTAREDQQAREEDVAALFAPQFAAQQVRATDVPIDRIRPNPFQARRQFVDLEELAQVIRTQGFTSRLRVRRDPQDEGYFQLVYGERRLRAAKLAALTMLPVEVAEHSDDDLIEIGLAENIQRRDLEPLEEAQAFRTLIDQRGYSIRRLAERIGKDKGYIENRLALLHVPEDVQQMVEQRPDSVRAAREIAKLPTLEERRPLIEGVVAGSLTDRDIRTHVQAARGGSAQPSSPAIQPPHRTPDQAAQPEALPRPAAQLSLDDDVQTIQALVRRWQRALEHGQVSPLEVATALAAIDQALAAIRALLQVEESVR